MLKSGKKYHLWDMVAYPFRVCPVISATQFLYQMMIALMPAAEVFVTAAFINSAIKIVTEGAPREIIYWPLAGVAGILAFQWTMYRMLELLDLWMNNAIRKRLSLDIFEKRARLNYAHVENNDTWDLVKRISNKPEDRFGNIFNQTLNFGSFTVRVASIVILLAAYVWWAALLLIVLVIPVIVIGMKGGKRQYGAEQEATKFDRRHEYLFNVMTSREAVEERSLFGFSKWLLPKYEDSFRQSRRINIRMQTKWGIRSKYASVLICVVLGVVILSMAPSLIAGVVSAGIYISLIQAIGSVIFSVGWELTLFADRTANNLEYIKEFTKFMALEESKDALCVPRFGQDIVAVEFRNVTFVYPGTDRKVLNGINLRLEAGKHYSFVGANGAGKTTVTKLLTGLYTNYEGEILIDGRELKTIPAGELKGYTACVYQDYAKYQLTVRQNIAIGAEGVDISDMDAIIEAVGLTEAVANLPNGLDTPLGKIEADGQDLSGGQWQRLALARAIASPAPLRILDEPTAALDPISESELYSHFEAISRGKMTIFISHRLGSTKLAEEIFVIDEGKIVEKGAHDELMAAGGLYAEMYESQRSWYL